MIVKVKILSLFAVSILLSSCMGSQNTQSGVKRALSGKGCTNPCWETIQPGKTTQVELVSVLNNLGIDYENTPNSPPRNSFYTFDATSPLDSGGGFSVQVLNNVVDRITMPANICISTLVEEYGRPPRIYKDQSGTADWLVYDQEGLTFQVDSSDSTRVSFVVLFAESSAESEREFSKPLAWESVQEQYSGECEDIFSTS